MTQNPLAAKIAARIAMTGPITLADYMADCLFDPDHGYYTTAQVFGASGDFITAPEISQMFGELLGLCLAQYWLDIGAPDRFTLAELGPGRGVLMADVLRATKGVAGFHAAMEVHLVEASPRLRGLQAQALLPHAPIWHDHASDLPDDRPLFLLANEFFDALPIRQFTRAADGWRETVVGLRDGRLTLGQAPVTEIAGLGQAEQGELREMCPGAAPIAAAIGGTIARQGGLALIIDYGAWDGRGDTFQAMSRHGYTDPLAEPGQADLTAHVDFAALARAAQPAHHAFATQGALLRALGIDARAKTLAQRLTGAALETHLAAHRRLTDPAEMGSLFKVLALYPPQAPLPPGFAPSP